MDAYTIASVILTLAVLIAYINHRFVRIPASIAIMLGALSISLFLLILDGFTRISIATDLSHLLLRTDFHGLLLNGMLSFLLFAGAMHIDLSYLKSGRWEIGILAVFSTIASTILIGYCMYALLPLLGIHMPLINCLLFGALISPTDPIAVLSITKQMNAPRRLQTIISGESLFNDGVAIVIFVTLFNLVVKHEQPTLKLISEMFVQQAVGGIIFGTILGLLATQLLRHCREVNIVILIMVAIVTGGYHLAIALDISGPLAMVVSGIIVGNEMHKIFADNYCKQIILFWDIIDELLNAALFLLIGFEMLTIKASTVGFIAMLGIIPLVLLIRWITVAIPIRILSVWRHQMPYTISVLTWGGLRGGLAVALALSIPRGDDRGFTLALTYSVVVFSIIIQGLSMKPLARKATSAAISEQQNQHA